MYLWKEFRMVLATFNFCAEMKVSRSTRIATFTSSSLTCSLRCILACASAWWMIEREREREMRIMNNKRGERKRGSKKKKRSAESPSFQVLHSQQQWRGWHPMDIRGCACVVLREWLTYDTPTTPYTRTRACSRSASRSPPPAARNLSTKQKCTDKTCSLARYLWWRHRINVSLWDILAILKEEGREGGSFHTMRMMLSRWRTVMGTDPGAVLSRRRSAYRLLIFSLSIPDDFGNTLCLLHNEEKMRRRE